jgi:hypothetical protein
MKCKPGKSKMVSVNRQYFCPACMGGHFKVPYVVIYTKAHPGLMYKKKLEAAKKNTMVASSHNLADAATFWEIRKN